MIILKRFPSGHIFWFTGKELCSRMGMKTINHPGVHKANFMGFVKRRFVCNFAALMESLSAIAAPTTIRIHYKLQPNATMLLAYK